MKSQFSARKLMAAFLFLAVFCQLVDAQIVAPNGLVLTEVMWKSSHPETNDIAGTKGRADGDWFEITNSSSSVINLEGYVFDDDDFLGVGAGDPNDYSIFPFLEVQPGETILMIREDHADEGFRDAWGLSPDLRILSECTNGGEDPFSGISSSGDALAIYPPHAVNAEGQPLDTNGVALSDPASNGVPVAPYLFTDFPPATPGFSRAWNINGTEIGLSVDGENGAYTAATNGEFIVNGDGTETPPMMGSGSDVASPGSYVDGSGMVQSPLIPGLPQYTLTNAPCFEANGDFDADGDYGCGDVDALVASIVAGDNDATYDLTGDGLVDGADLEAWLAEAGSAEVESGNAYLPGDANLDGFVDVSDLNIWSGNKFSQDAGWCGGDFNADGFADVSDLNIWSGNKFQEADGTQAVPEPQSWILAVMSVMLLVGRRSRNS